MLCYSTLSNSIGAVEVCDATNRPFGVGGIVALLPVTK